MQDDFLKLLAEDTVLYVRTVCNTIIMEVPKAIVHCQGSQTDCLQPSACCTQSVHVALLAYVISVCQLPLPKSQALCKQLGGHYCYVRTCATPGSDCCCACAAWLCDACWARCMCHPPCTHYELACTVYITGSCFTMTNSCIFFSDACRVESLLLHLCIFPF